MKQLVCLLALLLIPGLALGHGTPTPTPSGSPSATPSPMPTGSVPQPIGPVSNTSCVYSGPDVIEYYLDGNGQPQNVVHHSGDTIIYPFMVSGDADDYHHATAGCALMNNGQMACQNWPSFLWTTIAPAPMNNPTNGADPNAMFMLFSQWVGDPNPYDFLVPTENPTAFQYQKQVNPLWNQIGGTTMAGTCYKQVFTDAMDDTQADVIETESGGVYGNPTVEIDWCNANEAQCIALNRGTEHALVIVTDSAGDISLTQTSAKVSIQARGTCFEWGEAYDSLSGTPGNTSCPGTE